MHYNAYVCYNQVTMKKSSNGFTIIELVVVIVIIGILATIGGVYFSSIQANARDSKRASQTTIIAEALEKYYETNGEYPACSNVNTSTLKNLDPNVLIAPNAPSDTLSSIVCQEQPSGDTDDYAYDTQDTSQACQTSGCSAWMIKYKEESTGKIKIVASRRGINLGTIGDIDPADQTINIPELTATTNGSYQIDLDWGSVPNAISYEVERYTDTSFANPTSTSTAETDLNVTGLNPNTTYYFRVRAINNNIVGSFSDEAHATTGVQTLTCPTGFIIVPGNPTYNTTDFCVMKYEAKNNGSNQAVSTATGTLWTGIAQDIAGSNDAKGYSEAACSGCHLMTESEWLTIAENVLNVSSNWSNDDKVNGYIYSGNNDGQSIRNNNGGIDCIVETENCDSIGGLEADPNGDNGYYGTFDTAPSNQRRTLTLSNGSVIWDLAGNIYEWIDGSIIRNRMPGLNTDSGMIGKGWENDGFILDGLLLSPHPNYSAIISLLRANNWTYNRGIGAVWSNYNASGTTVMGITVGGSFNDHGPINSNGLAGILSMDLGSDQIDSDPVYIGFRVAK